VRRKISRKAVYDSALTTPNSHAQQRLGAVRVGPPHAGGEHHAAQDQGHGEDRGRRRALAEHQPREQPDEHHLGVAEHRREACADEADRVVPERERHAHEPPAAIVRGARATVRVSAPRERVEQRDDGQRVGGRKNAAVDADTSAKRMKMAEKEIRTAAATPSRCSIAGQPTPAGATQR
jgi:hypothetical protein